MRGRGIDMWVLTIVTSLKFDVRQDVYYHVEVELPSCYRVYL